MQTIPCVSGQTGKVIDLQEYRRGLGLVEEPEEELAPEVPAGRRAPLSWWESGSRLEAVLDIGASVAVIVVTLAFTLRVLWM